MHQAEIVVLLFTAVGILAVLAHKITLPYPIVLVLGGLALSFVPRLPAVNLNPDVVFYFILPAVIYPAALFTSWRDFRRNLRPILLLAIGLVLATMLAVAWIAHSIVPALPWAAAFALGAIVSPPDAVAATAIIRRLGVPHRIQVILEGESLVNDATALVALQFAIAALVTGTFSPAYAAGRFVWAAAGGIGIGLLVGVAMRWVQSHLNDPPIQITFSLLTPFIAYLSAERMHASGVLATVARRHFSRLALAADDHRADPPPSLCVLGNDRVPSQRIRFHCHWSATSQNPARIESTIAHWRLYECDRRLRNCDLSPFRVGDTGDLSVSFTKKRATGAQPNSVVAARCDRRLGRHARRGVTRRCVRVAASAALRTAVSRARLHFVSRLFSDPGHARVTGSDAARVDSEARHTS